MPIDHDNPLAAEILQEMAAAYFGACRKMVDALDALKAFDSLPAASVPSAAQLAQRTALVTTARERVFFVVIQREAMKLVTSEDFFTDYEVPHEVRAHLGPSPQR
jgi:hypothetical protein